MTFLVLMMINKVRNDGPLSLVPCGRRKSIGKRTLTEVHSDNVNEREKA